MSAQFEFLHEGKGVYIDCYGNLITEDLVKAYHEIYRQDTALALHYHVIDLRDLESLEISAENLLKLAEQDKRRLQSNTNLKIAFLTNHDVVRSVVFMWCGYIGLGEQHVKQFSNLEQAYGWLGFAIPTVVPEAP